MPVSSNGGYANLVRLGVGTYRRPYSLTLAPYNRQCPFPFKPRRAERVVEGLLYILQHMIYNHEAENVDHDVFFPSRL